MLALESIKRYPLIWLLVLLSVSKAVLFFVVIPEYSSKIELSYGIGFADNYDKLARNLALGNGYRFDASMSETMMREPGYPLFLAGVFKIFDYGIEWARLTNMLLSLGIAGLLWRLTFRITEDKAVALLTVILTLLHPGFVIAEARGGFEILFIASLLLFMFGIHRALESGRYRDYFLAGIVLGCVVLIRSTPLLFPLAILFYLIVIGPTWNQRLLGVAKVATLTIAMVLTMSPWVVRNYMLVQEIVPTSSVQGVAAQIGQYICDNLTFEQNFGYLDDQSTKERIKLASEEGFRFSGKYYQYFYKPQDELEFNRMLMDKVTDQYRARPALYAKCVSVNLFKFWFAGKTWTVTWINMIVQLPLIVFAVAGAAILWKRSELNKAAPIGLFILYLYAVHVMIHSQARYSIPLVSFLSILASIALVSLWRRNRVRSPA